MNATETELDARDAEIFSRRFHAYQDIHGPRVGDYVHFADDTYERISHIWDDGVQTSEGGSFYLGDGYVSFSGGLNPPIPTDALDYRADHKRGGVWFFHHDQAMAHNGVDASMDFRVYEVGGVRQRVRGMGREWRSDYIGGVSVAPLRDLTARRLPSDAARAVGRFNPDGVEGYRAATAPNAPLRETRSEAEQDEADWLGA